MFDWDIIKRQQLAAGGDGALETNPDGTVKAAAGAGAGAVGVGAGEGVAMNDAAYGAAPTAGGASGARGQAAESGKADAGTGGVGPDGSRLDDSAGDGRGEPGQRRSIISSIR